MGIGGEELVLVGDRPQIAGMQAEQHLRLDLGHQAEELPAVEAKQPLAFGEEEALGGKRRQRRGRIERGGIVRRQRLPVPATLPVGAHFVHGALARQPCAQTLRTV